VSADNGIYILETEGPEFRVAHLMAVENINFDENAPEPMQPPGNNSIYEYRPEDAAHCAWQEANQKRYDSQDPDVLIKNAREMWAGSPVFTSKSFAFMYADEISKKYTILEYGISTIKIPRKF